MTMRMVYIIAIAIFMFANNLKDFKQTGIYTTMISRWTLRAKALTNSSISILNPKMRLQRISSFLSISIKNISITEITSKPVI